MHPIERLRYVARSSGAPVADAARESISALAAFHDDPQALLTACRRLVDRHPHSGPMLWMASKVLTAAEPLPAARAAASALDRDPTAAHLIDGLPQDATLCVLGWPDVVSGALGRRGDIEVLAIDVFGEGTGLVRRLRNADQVASAVPVEGMASAIVHSDLLLLESPAIGPSHFIAVAGSWPAAAVARNAAVDVWLVGGVGRMLPRLQWDALGSRAGVSGYEPWTANEEFVPLSLVDSIVGPGGLTDVASAVASAECPFAPELLALPE